MLIAAGIQVGIGWILTAEMTMPAVHRGQKHIAKTADMIKNSTPEEFRWAIAMVPALFVVAFVLCLILPETAPGKTSTQENPTP